MPILVSTMAADGMERFRGAYEAWILVPSKPVRHSEWTFVLGETVLDRLREMAECDEYRWTAGKGRRVFEGKIVASISSFQPWLRNISFQDTQIFDDKKLLKKLRWTTLGYQHDWNSKVYSEEKRSDVPEDLRRLSNVVAKLLFGPDMDFRAEAVIVNFYRMNSTLAGHVDHSERNFGLPLFSFSFGQSAVFVLGGQTLDEEPIAVKIGSGDVVVMSGECRLAYHGVPRIFSSDTKFDALSEEGSVDEAIASYLNKNRINMNVRQVD